LFEDFIKLLLQQNINEEFLEKRGVDLGFLAKQGTPHQCRLFHKDEDEEEYKQEETDHEGDDDTGSEEETPAKKLRTKSGSRKRKKAEVAHCIQRSDTEEGVSLGGRLRRSPDKWTPKEDEKLMELVEKYGVGTKKWRQIAEELGTTKNSAKCAQHWRRVLAPSIHKGSWSAEEERKLLQGVERYGLTQWTLVAKDIPGRTDIQCRYHYMRQQNSRAFSWTVEEEKMLKQLVSKHGAVDSWIKVSNELAEKKIRRTPRTALECQEHWDQMQKRLHSDD